MDHVLEEFISAYNEELARLRCGLRVRASRGKWSRGSFLVIDTDGSEIGMLPDTVEPIEFAAFETIFARCLKRGTSLQAELKCERD